MALVTRACQQRYDSSIDSVCCYGSIVYFKDFSIGTAKVKKSSGFGVGAFEEEDDDIYDAEDRNQYDRSVGTQHPLTIC